MIAKLSVTDVDSTADQARSKERFPTAHPREFGAVACGIGRCTRCRSFIAVHVMKEPHYPTKSRVERT